MTKFDALIPSLFRHNHASNIMPIKNGDILCAWFGGTKEGRPDISIVISRLKPGTSVWSEPLMLSGDPARSEQNPVLFETQDGKLWLIYTAQDSIHQDTATVQYRTSYDNGYTWSMADTLFDSPGTFVRQPPVILDTGELLLPVYHCLKSDEGFMGKDYSTVKISSDNGITWNEHEIKESTGLVHMCPVKLPDGSILGFFRSRKADSIYISKSTDNGKKWSKPTPTILPNNNSSIQCIRFNNGHIAIVYNDTNARMSPSESNIPPWFDKSDMESGVNLHKGLENAVWGVERVPLTIAVSEDEGKTWPYRRNLENGENCGINPEFSYPSIKQTKDDRIHITYTYLRQSIKYVSFTEDWVMDRPYLGFRNKEK